MEERQIPASAAHFFEQNERFIIAGHKEPDGDCISCQLALQSFITRFYKKPVHLVSAGPFKRTEIKAYETLFTTDVPQPFTELGTALIIVDCSNATRIGEITNIPTNVPTFIIDHHASNDSTGEFTFVNETSPAAALLVLQLIETLSANPPSPHEAELLFFGLSTDSGFFRHLDAESAPVFQAASRMVTAGANPKKIFAMMNGGKSPESRILLSRILSRVTYHYSGHLAVSWETLEDTQLYGLEGRDSDSLYQLIQSVRGVEAIVIIRQETEQSCTIGFRSLDKVNVCAIAQDFGGGGHKNASGAKKDGTIAELKPLIISAFEKAFEQN